MGAVWMRARNELRTRWRAMLSLALIAGLGGGAAIAAFAGARRTVSVYPRFRVATNAFDDLIGQNGSSTPPDQFVTDVLSSPAVTHLPAIADYSLTDPYSGEISGPSGVSQGFPDVFIVGGPDGKLGVTLDRMKLLSGRYAVPTRADEVTVSSFEAQHLGARVGSTLTLRFPNSTRTLHVVGIGLIAGAVDPSAGAYTPVVLLTPAFYAQNGPELRVGPSLAVRVRGGLKGLPELERELTARNEALLAAAKTSAERTDAENRNVSTIAGAAPQTESIRRTALFEGAGLSIFGGLALLTVLAIFAQLLVRQVLMEGDEQLTLRALGMSRAQLFGLAMLRVALVGVAAAIISLALAILASPLFPIGFMHGLETSPGLNIDMLALPLGALAILVLTCLVGVIPALRASSARVSHRESTVGTNKAANTLAAAAFPPTAVAGVRMALEPGHGSTSVPVRTTIFGTILALAALLAALTFGAGLRHLVATPSLSGWNFDLIAPGSGAALQNGVDPVVKTEQALLANPVVGSITLGTFPSFKVKGILMGGYSFAPGPIGPSIASGRAPKAPDEIAFTVKTLRALHASIGQTIPVTIVDPSTNAPVITRSLRIVGTAVTPQIFFNQYTGNYSAVTSESLIDSMALALKVAGPGPDQIRLGGDTFFIRFRPGISVDVGADRVRNDLLNSGGFFFKRASSSDLSNLDHIANLPNVLGALLALIAAGTLAHTLITSVRRRRRDLAVLRALGFVRRQVGLTVAWQATTIALISLAVGLPLGAILGRIAWRFFVNQLGYVPVTIVPLIGVLLAIPAAIALANIIASIPARAAARTEPAVVLRAE